MSAVCNDQSETLTILTHMPADALKAFVDTLLPDLGEVQVLLNRTGLVMVPCLDSRQGAPFHLGEALVAEARVRLGEAEGYGACLGRDPEQALAVAILDAALCGGQMTERIMAFVAAQGQALAEQDRELLCHVEATRVELETF